MICMIHLPLEDKSSTILNGDTVSLWFCTRVKVVEMSRGRGGTTIKKT